ncbi:MAG: hypothetical protein NZU63_05755 [Gemmataceae bacterium]|nr:hypothetical protein [Gemmataceae bacterium]MDW8244249.1 hypothetical protein [Thermogemmata sp.]
MLQQGWIYPWALTVTLVVCLLTEDGTSVLRAQAPEFLPYASSAGRYKGIFPGPVKTDEVEIPAGDNSNAKLKVVIDSVELRGGTLFVISYVDAPMDVAQQPAAQRLDKVRDAVKGPRGKVLEQRDLTIGYEKYPARDLLIETPEGFIRHRIVIAGARLYQISVRGSREVVTSSSVDRFFNAFEVTR